MLVRKVREERAKEQTAGRKMCDCEPFFCVSKCGVEQTRAEKQWSFSSKWWTFRRKWCTFSFYVPAFFEQRTCIGDKGRIKPRFIGENGQSSCGEGDVTVRGVSESCGRNREEGRSGRVDGCFCRKARKEKKKDGSDKVNCLSRLGGSRVCFRVVPK